jgi:hypothetical protein
VSKQPATGVLFKSANNRTWSPEQMEDLKFNLSHEPNLKNFIFDLFQNFIISRTFLHGFIKNYLTENEMQQLQRLVSAYLDIAESMALRQIPLTMEDWENRLNKFIEATDRTILQNAGKVSAEIARAHAESEFEKYRIIQDQLFESDFDREIKRLKT